MEERITRRLQAGKCEMHETDTAGYLSPDIVNRILNPGCRIAKGTGIGPGGKNDRTAEHVRRRIKDVITLAGPVGVNGCPVRVRPAADIIEMSSIRPHIITLSKHLWTVL